MNTRNKRAFAFILCIAFIFVTFFSLLFIEKEADHDCTGTDCPICACVHQAEQCLKYLGTGAETSMKIPVMMIFAFLTVGLYFFVPCISLVSEKIRLND